jgi:hypothetical protein
MNEIQPTLLPALRGLNDMLRQFWPEHDGRTGIPLAFWKIEDDDLLFDALQYLSINVLARGGRSGEGHTEAEVDALPDGFRLLTV